MSSNSNQRLSVFPTRMSLNNMKIKHKGAETGHSLLKRKSDALTARFRVILQRIRTAKYEMGELMRTAALSMAQVNYAAGDISFAVREAVVGPASFKVRARIDNVSGVQLPVFEAFIEGQAVESGLLATSTSTTNTTNTSNTSVNSNGSGFFDLMAISRGGQQVQKCRETNIRVLQSLLDLASLQTAFQILDDVIKVTNRRVNALEYVVLPRTENTINYITSELDEQDREEFFRLKKVQSKKKEKERIQEAEKVVNGLEVEVKVFDDDDDVSGGLAAKNLLDEEYDPDIIF